MDDVPKKEQGHLVIKASPLKIWGLTILPIVLAVGPLLIERCEPGAILPYRNTIIYLYLGFASILLSIRIIGIWRAIIVAVIMFNLFALYLPYHTQDFSKEGEVKSNCHAIQIALYRYAETNEGMFPDDIIDLIENEYLAELPNNPYTGREMVPVDFGAGEFEGNFTYIPVTEEDVLVGYYLLGYGDEDSDGLDVDGDGIDDHVILILDSFADEEVSNLPPLEELLAQ